MARKEDLIVGLDIGTTKVCAIVGEITHDGIDVIGIGSHPSRGLRKGVVVNIEATVESIKKAIEEAELMAGCDITSVYAGISGNHVKGINSHGIVAVKNKEEVTEYDVTRVIDAAKAVAIPMDREVIHVIPQEFIVDEQDGIKEPLGMSGVRLEAKVHIISAALTSAQNIVKCANRCGLNVNDIVLEPLASSEATLSADEKELGVVLVDIGGGTSDLIIYSEGSVVYTSVLSLGGNHMTNDIAVGLRTPSSEAEKIKQKYGCALSSLVHSDETIEVPSVGGRKPRVLSRQILAEIIEPRVEEMFSLIRQEVVKSGYENVIASGVVLTGGATLLEGMPELAEQVFDFPVRRGYPRGIGGLVDVVKSPMYATGVGLVLHGSRNLRDSKEKMTEDGVYRKMKEKMKNWFVEIF